MVGKYYMKKNYVIEIKETNRQQLLKKSMNNIRLEQIQLKVNLEAELDYNKHFTGGLIPVGDKIEYLENIGRKFMNRKKVRFLL